MENTQVDDSMRLVPVFITALELLTEEGASNELLSKFVKGRVYKCYIDNQGKYFLFPGEKEPYAWMMPMLSYGTENYNMSFVVLTESNFTEYDILDEDMEYLSEIFQSDIKNEIATVGGKEIASSLDMSRHIENKKKILQVDDREALGLFKVLNDVNPRIARSLVEFGKYITLSLQNSEGLDGMMLDILMDEDLGKGACVSGAMNDLLRYSQGEGSNEIKNLLTAGMHIIIELSRNVKKNG
jgi:hypothetical protein